MDVNLCLILMEWGTYIDRGKQKFVVQFPSIEKGLFFL